jgi:hypothetical protein
MRSVKRKAPTPPPASIPDDVFDMQLSSPAQSLLMSIQSRRAQAQSKPAADLYHYTNAAGLLGIIENNKIWATHINYLNDASELVYARRLIEEAIARHRQTFRSAVAQEFFRLARDTFDVSHTMDVFVACFCEEGDLLSQWRGYAQAGEGYSIGVDGEQLGSIGGGKNFFFGPVCYDREMQGDIIDTVLAMLLDGLETMTARKSAKAAVPLIGECVRVFRRAVWYPLVTFKDAMFAAENEWRAIEVMRRDETPKRIRFRSSGSKLIPYIELDFSQFQQAGKIPIRCVFHGPTLNPDLSVRVLRLLLAKHGYSEAEVLGSKIPLRL